MPPNSPYDINDIFSQMEQKLTESYKRNMSKHTEEEVKEGFKWNMWQAKKLKDMKAYRSENRVIVDKYSKIAKDAVTGIIKSSYGAGQNIADSLLKGLTSVIKDTESFGVMNRRKVDALLQAVNNDLDKANAATLRLTDDAYRQIVFKAEVMNAAGATTIKQSVDMASKDFLNNGINAIEYKNGAKVNVASYAEMAVRTSAKKAYLTGEGARQAEWGVTLVQVTSYGACSHLCLPWQGQVYIDDVYAGGKKDENSPYNLLSMAMAGGLYHPNCRHTQGAYFEGISDTPPPPTQEETQIIQDNYEAEQKQRGIERNIRRYKRVAEGSLDPDNEKKAQVKVNAWQSQMRQHLNDNPQLSRKYSNEKTYGIPLNPDKTTGYVSTSAPPKLESGVQELVMKPNGMYDTTKIKTLYHSVTSEKARDYVLEHGITADDQSMVYLADKPMGKQFKYTFKVTIPNNTNLFDWREVWDEGLDKVYNKNNPYFVYEGNISSKHVKLVK